MSRKMTLMRSEVTFNSLVAVYSISARLSVISISRREDECRRRLPGIIAVGANVRSWRTAFDVRKLTMCEDCCAEE